MDSPLEFIPMYHCFHEKCYSKLTTSNSVLKLGLWSPDLHLSNLYNSRHYKGQFPLDSLWVFVTIRWGHRYIINYIQTLSKYGQRPNYVQPRSELLWLRDAVFLVAYAQNFIVLCFLMIIGCIHNCDVLMGTTTSQITSFTIAYSAVYSGTNQTNLQSSASVAFVRGSTGDRWLPRTKGQ